MGSGFYQIGITALQWLRQSLNTSLLPAQCALCGGACAQVLCAPCREQYLGQFRPRCRRCANPLDDVSTLCGRCLRHAPAYDATFTAADYAAPVDQLLLQLKFGARLAERGFNQALEIARPLARALLIPLLPRLAIRVRETQAQSGVAPRERKANLVRAFIVAPEYAARVGGCHVGIVDDVMSSGHTANALAAAFNRHGAAKVTILVMARTPPH